jgi:hypothetical protein
VTFDIHIRAPKRRRPLPRLTAVDSLEAKATVMTLMDNCLSTSSPSARNNAAALTPVHTLGGPQKVSLVSDHALPVASSFFLVVILFL